MNFLTVMNHCDKNSNNNKNNVTVHGNNNRNEEVGVIHLVSCQPC